MSNVLRLRKGLRIVAAFALLGAILACGGGDDDSSSSSSGSANSFMIAPGFTPDPRTATGEAGGSIEASTRNPSCRGWIGLVSDHTLHLTSAFANLRVIVSAPADTTLVIQLADGTYRCDDDSEGTNPIVQGPFPAGIHRVFVGTYSRNPPQPVQYTIGVTELATVTAASLGGGAAPAPTPTPTPTPTPAVPPSTGTTMINLSPGFVPDPHRASGTAGGPVMAMQMTNNAPGCSGSVPAAPQHTFVAGGNFNNLRIMAHSATDTTLVVRKPDGTWLCNDDSPGNFPNPMVEGAFPPGAYMIYVGTFAGRPPAPYNLGISELSSVTPATIAN